MAGMQLSSRKLRSFFITIDLREANDTLGERYDLLKAEVDLRERRLRAEEKSRLYDRIAREIAPQLNRVDELIKQSREHPNEANALLSQVCVISAYIKRRANLILLGEEKATVAARELESCLRESLDNLRLCGVITYLDCHCDGQAAVEQIVAMYDLFENVTEALQSKLSAMVVTASYTDGVLRMRIQAGCKETVNEPLNLTLDGGTVISEAQEEDLIVDAVMEVGGAKA